MATVAEHGPALGVAPLCRALDLPRATVYRVWHSERYPVAPRPRCSGCGRVGPVYDHQPARRFAFVPLGGIPVFLVYALRRVHCARCGVRVERVPWAAGKSPITRSLALYLADWAKLLSWQEVARRFGVNWRQVYALVDFVVGWGLRHREVSGVQALGIDEIQFGKGHQYLTVVYQLCGRVPRLLYVGQRRDASSLSAFFESMGGGWCASITHVCTGHVESLPQGHRGPCPPSGAHPGPLPHREAAQRGGGHRAAPRGGPPSQRRGDGAQGDALRLSQAPGEPHRAPAPTVERGADCARSGHGAGVSVEGEVSAVLGIHKPLLGPAVSSAMVQGAMRSRLAPMKKFVHTIRSHEDLILNWFEAKKQYSGGVVEGMNRKINLVTRKSYGFRQFEVLQVALFHTLGGLPEPERTHRF